MHRYLSRQSFLRGILALSVFYLLSGCTESLPGYQFLYFANGADSGSIPDAEIFYAGDSVVVSENTGTLSRRGNSFIGWNTLSSGEGEDYQPGDTILMPESSVSLYAMWDAYPVYSVTYSAETAESGSVPVDSDSYLEDEKVIVLGNTGGLTRNGWTFIGWNTDEEDPDTEYVSGSEFLMGTADVALFAVWTLEPAYTVTYHDDSADTGSVPSDSNNYLENMTVTVLGNTGGLAISGGTFTGWNTEYDGSGTAYNAGDQLTMGCVDLDLYAQWSFPSGSIVIVNPEYPQFSLSPSTLTLQTGGGTVEQTIFVSAGDGINITSCSWLINGTSRGTGSSLTLNTETNPDWFVTGPNTLTLVVVIEETPYSESFIFVVEQY